MGISIQRTEKISGSGTGEQGSGSRISGLDSRVSGPGLPDSSRSSCDPTSQSCYTEQTSQTQNFTPANASFQLPWWTPPAATAAAGTALVLGAAANALKPGDVLVDTRTSRTFNCAVQEGLTGNQLVEKAELFLEENNISAALQHASFAAARVFLKLGDLLSDGIPPIDASPLYEIIVTRKLLVAYYTNINKQPEAIRHLDEITSIYANAGQSETVANIHSLKAGLLSDMGKSNDAIAESLIAGRMFIELASSIRTESNRGKSALVLNRKFSEFLDAAETEVRLVLDNIHETPRRKVKTIDFRQTSEILGLLGQVHELRGLYEMAADAKLQAAKYSDYISSQQAREIKALYERGINEAMRVENYHAAMQIAFKLKLFSRELLGHRRSMADHAQSLTSAENHMRKIASKIGLVNKSAGEEEKLKAAENASFEELAIKTSFGQSGTAYRELLRSLALDLKTTPSKIQEELAKGSGTVFNKIQRVLRTTNSIHLISILSEQAKYSKGLDKKRPVSRFERTGEFARGK